MACSQEKSRMCGGSWRNSVYEVSAKKATKDVKSNGDRVGHFINFRNGKALDVSGGKDEEGRPVIVWNKHNGANQKWGVVYLDNKEKEQTKGLNEDFGFHINRPFYIKSRMLFGRVAELVGASNIVLKRYTKNRTEQ
jgi:hypothetical protein